MRVRPVAAAALLAAALGMAPRAAAQSSFNLGRVTLYGQFMHTTRTDGAPVADYSELTASVSLYSRPADDGGFEYALDARGADYPSASRPGQFSLYAAWVGARLSGGGLGFRVGQMWLNDIGGLGAIGGAAFEARPFEASAIGRFRFGLFAGLEPDLYQAGYVSGVKKFGGYVALDGEQGRRHSVGYVQIRDQGLTERSVVTVQNFIPVGREFFLYQVAEVDLTGPGGTGSGARLTYIFVNARYRVTNWLEFQGLYHHGLSIDTRTITQDILNGRPVDPRALDGFLFGSVGGRVTIEPVRGLRFWGGYSQDKGSRTGETYPRYQAGFTALNVFGSGFDLTASDNRYGMPSGGSYDSWYGSIGRSLGPSVYLTADYTTSLSTLNLTGADGIVVQSHPRSKRYSLSGVVNLSRAFSVFMTAEQIRDDGSRQTRGLLGISFRF